MSLLGDVVAKKAGTTGSLLDRVRSVLVVVVYLYVALYLWACRYLLVLPNALSE
jgi:hypothetical protein